ncbi:MAG: response regulator, partial [Thiobacillus sp.]|nr:response regulator [Thiobacillus sp.]
MTHPDFRLIHLLDGDLVQADCLSQALQKGGYRVRVFTEPAAFCAACKTAAAERPAAVVMEVSFGEGDTATGLLAEIEVDLARCPPVILISARNDLPARLAAFRAGAARYLVKPVEPVRLIELLDALTGRQPPQPYRVMVVDDDPQALDTHAAMLRAAGMTVHTLSQPLRILDALNDCAPDVALIEADMAEARGPELAAVLRECDEYLHLPILFLTAETSISRQLQALHMGGDDLLVKPVLPEHLVAAIAARAGRARQSTAIRRRLQTALYERECEHLALDHHAIVSIADAAGNITYANDKFCEISGYQRGDLLGQNHRIVKSGEHSPAFYQSLWHTISRGIVWQGELCNRRKDGSRYWVESTIAPFVDGEGKPYQYVSMRTDITHVKAAEETLRRQGDMQRLIAEAGADLLAASAAEMDAAIDRTLQRSGEHLSADRAYLFLFSECGTRMSNTHEWCAAGIVHQCDKVREMPLEATPWWWAQVAAGGMVIVSDVDDLPPEAAAEKSLLQDQQIQSLFAFPLQKKGRPFGFIGFDAVRSRRNWSLEEIRPFKLMADIISSALARKRAE